jgi:ribonucleoside-diphosphate reductase alpha subunit
MQELSLSIVSMEDPIIELAHPLLMPQLQLENRISKVAIDRQLAETSATLIERDYGYTYLAARLVLNQIYKTTEKSFSSCMALIMTRNANLLEKKFYNFIQSNAANLDDMVDQKIDKRYSYQSVVKMQRQYLLRQNTIPFERPQYMYLRIAVALFYNEENVKKSLRQIEKYYRILATQNISAASPVIFNAGTVVGQLSSCFLVGGPDDSIQSILDTNTKFGLMMKGAGGIGFNVSRIRSAGRPIHSSGGTSNGVVPLLKLFDATGRYVDQGGNRRPGVVNCSIEPWHPEFEEIIGLRAPGRQDDKRLFNVHLTVYMCDLLMRRAEIDYKALATGSPRVMWSFFSPDVVPSLVTTWGEDFERVYHEAEARQLYTGQVPAANLIQSIVYYQQWTGEPCVVFKDSVNRHSNQLHMGTLTNLNLCVEIALYCDQDYTAVCNLASICLANFILTRGKPEFLFDVDHDLCPFDWDGFYAAVEHSVRLLNQIVDRTVYPLPEARRASMELRPIGLGIQGLADVLIFLEIPFGSAMAILFDATVYASLHYFSLLRSCALAEKYGHYQHWKESPWFKENKFHYDGFPQRLANVAPPGYEPFIESELRERVQRYGLRNSQLIAQMPTASTAHLTGNTESFEPLENILYVMREISGNFISMNERAANLLRKYDCLTPENILKIKKAGGSIQGEDFIAPEHVKRVLRTAYEIPQREMVEHAIARAPYIDQSMSLNVFFGHDAAAKLPSYLFHAWRGGLKTGTYYVRSKQRGSAIKFTVAPEECTSCSA